MTAAVHPGHLLLHRIRALAAEQANRLRAKPAELQQLQGHDDVKTIETLEATARLVDLIETDVHHLQRVCGQLVDRGPPK